ncbi:hypothetical protein PVT71_24355 (plasmid) [Salipiger sp. H15]|uniref:Tetratricopeptide repeat protein n=1 Tax=Alloyangia sp. H15 TaxID=3029062 RepID=A0AAU8APP5_9RHOB
MNVHALTRKEKRALSARGAKLYGVGGDAAVALFHAYQFLRAGDLPQACGLVVPLTRSIPGNPHAWIVLGLAALNRSEGATAKAFFTKAEESAPKSLDVLTGLAKAHFLCAEPKPSALRMEEAFAAGCTDPDIVELYLTLVKMMGGILNSARLLEPVVGKIRSSVLAHKIALMLAEVGFMDRAAEWFERSHGYAPDSELGRCDAVSAHFHAGRMQETEAGARALLATDLKDPDPVMVLLIGALRFQSRHAELLEVIEGYEFRDRTLYARALAFAANAHADRGDEAAARHAYVEAMHIAEGGEMIGKAYGAFCLGHGDFAEGIPNYFKRLDPQSRRLARVENSAVENLQKHDHIYLTSEQGIGDQLALLALTRIMPVLQGTEVSFVSGPREAALLRDNTLGVRVITQPEAEARGEKVTGAQMVALGDLVRFLPDHPAEAHQGGFLQLDPEAVGAIRDRYAALAGDRPIFGMAWAARAIIGRLRSIALPELVALLPKDAFVVSLQYGDTGQEIAEAQALRPDVTFHTDPEIDQMADLAGFAAQCAALDRILSIDNTTVHVCGAIGHPNAHVLLPKGAETMWYWGHEASLDPWYGVLHLHRQAQAGDWSAALASLREALAA